MNNHEKMGGGNEKNEVFGRELAKKVGGAALIGATIIGTVLAGKKSTKEIMDTERAKDVERIEAESISFYEGPNVRQEPVVSNKEDVPNVVVNLDDKGKVVTIDFEGEVLHYENENDPNGGWFGMDAEKLADELEEEQYLSEKDAEDLKQKEDGGDGYVWVNDQYMSVEEKSND